MNLQKINQAREIVNERIDEILDFLGIEYKDCGRYYSFPCPIHLSDNSNSLSIYKETGKWGCWTNSCHQEHGNTFFDFVRAFMKTQEKELNLEQVCNLCLQILKTDIGNIKEISDYRFKIDSAKLVNSIIKRRKEIAGKISRKLIREKLYIPSKYYIERGYSPEVLDRYDVGLCNSYGKEMFSRIVVPIYDDSYRYMVGCVGRSQYKQCEICKKYHNPNRSCPKTQIEEMYAAKWKNSKGFNVDGHLYNYWFAKEHIKSSKTVIIVEGQGDVWRLEEAGIHCSVGVFGCKITDGQALLLEKSGAQNMVMASDNDEKGENFRKRVRERFNRFFNIYDIQTESKDFGEMTVDETKKIVIPIIERLC